MLSAKEAELLGALEPQAVQHGIEIVTVEVTGARKAPTIKVYIDTPDGVSFDQLAAAQAWIGPLMDELDPFPGAYTLEVSSPGIDRPLRTPAHFQRAVGEQAHIACTGPVDGRARFTGQIVAADDEAVTVAPEGAPEACIPYQAIKKAHVKGTVDFSR